MSKHSGVVRAGRAATNAAPAAPPAGPESTVHDA